jgi:hypothetical protein
MDILELPSTNNRIFWRGAEKAYEKGPYFLAKFYFESIGITQLTDRGKWMCNCATTDYLEETFFHFCKMLKMKLTSPPSLNYLKSGLYLYKRVRLMEMKEELREKQIQAREAYEQSRLLQTSAPRLEGA